MSTGIPTTITLTAVTMLAATTLDPTLLAAAVVTIIAALGGVTVQIINARSAAVERRATAERELLAATERKALFEQAQHATKLADDNNKKADALIKSTTEIHTLTNSTNSNLQKALELMTEKNVGLEKLMRQMESEKQTTAATRAVTDAQAAVVLHATAPSTAPPPPDVAITKAAETILTSIDDNTAAIEKNTAKTDANVQEMKDQKPQ